ncbi:MAG: hypothetical protein HY293_04435 [Planctomycetes bacterium]|nr:hypothetical protein [Planctomycetota bacterium]
MKKWMFGLPSLLLLAAGIGLVLPTGDELALYRVDDLVYMLDSPGVGISLATTVQLDPIIDVPLMMVGSDLAENLRLLVPGSRDEETGRTVEFTNGWLAVRATLFQHAAVRAALGAYRVRNDVAASSIDQATRAKAALSAALYGMITR